MSCGLSRGRAHERYGHIKDRLVPLERDVVPVAMILSNGVDGVDVNVPTGILYSRRSGPRGSDCLPWAGAGEVGHRHRLAALISKMSLDLSRTVGDSICEKSKGN